MLDVFLVPLGLDRYELYCEPGRADPDSSPQRDPPSGLISRVSRAATDLFYRAVREGEAKESSHPDAGREPRGRLRRWITTRLAETLAEQRLLWRLRTEPEVQLSFPADLSTSEAQTAVQARLRADLARHSRWCLIDTALAALFAPFTLVPGPNLPVYYFVFRAVGHLLSVRGARQALRRTIWTYRPSAPLTALRGLDVLAPALRAARLDEVNAALGLERLGVFVDVSSRRS